MKKIISLRILFLCFSLILLGCSKEDPVLEMEADPVSGTTDNYFTAKIDGKDFTVNDLSGTMTAEKQISDFGSINLSIKVQTDNGETMEFLILNYTGEKSYFFGDNFINGSWINYSQNTPPGKWRADKKANNFSNYPHSVSILSDNGTNIKGQFTFEGYNESDKSAKLFTEGDFNIKL